MQTTVKQNTRIASRNTAGKYQQEQMIDLLGIDLLQHNEFVFQCGIDFLNDIFPENDPIYVPFFQDHSRNSFFWKWFRNEWYHWQKSLNEFMVFHKVPLTFDYWTIEMRAIAFDKITHNSFETYLKFYINELRNAA